MHLRMKYFCLALSAAALLLAGCDFTDKESSNYPTRSYYLMDTDGNNNRYLFPDEGQLAVKVNPDGEYVFYRLSGKLYRFSVDDKTTYQYTLPFDWFGNYYPYYGVLYLQAEMGGAYDLYSVDVGTGDTQNLTQLYADTTFTYYHDIPNNSLYYTLHADSLYTLHHRDLATQQDVVIASNSLSDYFYVTSTPDNTALYYFHESDQEDMDGLFRMDLGTQEVTKIMSYETQGILAVTSPTTIQVGVDESFLILDIVVKFLSSGPAPGYYPGSFMSLMSNRREAISMEYALSGGILKQDIPANTMSSLSSGYVFWLSKEGNLIVYAKEK